MGDETKLRQIIDSGMRRAMEAAPEVTPERKRRVGIAAGGTAGLTAIISLLGNGWQAHLADQADARHGTAETQRHEREARIEAESEARCDERVGRAWTTYREHMQGAHGL